MCSKMKGGTKTCLPKLSPIVYKVIALHVHDDIISDGETKTFLHPCRNLERSGMVNLVVLARFSIDLFFHLDVHVLVCLLLS